MNMEVSPERHAKKLQMCYEHELEDILDRLKYLEGQSFTVMNAMSKDKGISYAKYCVIKNVRETINHAIDATKTATEII